MIMPVGERVEPASSFRLFNAINVQRGPGSSRTPLIAPLACRAGQRRSRSTTPNPWWLICCPTNPRVTGRSIWPSLGGEANPTPAKACPSRICLPGPRLDPAARFSFEHEGNGPRSARRPSSSWCASSGAMGSYMNNGVAAEPDGATRSVPDANAPLETELLKHYEIGRQSRGVLDSKRSRCRGCRGVRKLESCRGLNPHRQHQPALPSLRPACDAPRISPVLPPKSVPSAIRMSAESSDKRQHRRRHLRPRRPSPRTRYPARPKPAPTAPMPGFGPDAR